MANTGKKITISLKKIYNLDGSPTGDTKTNNVSDPDYIGPVTDTTACPVSTNLACPTDAMLTEASSGIVSLEMSFYSSIILNPSILKIRFKLVDSTTTVQATNTITLPNSTGNYFRFNFSSTPSETYYLRIEYLGTADVVLTTCNLTGITITT